MHHSLRHDGLDFLRYHADIGAIAAVVAEAIVADAIGEMAKKNDIVLESDIGPAPAAAATTAEAATAATPDAARRATANAAGAAATEALTAARRMVPSRSAGSNIANGVVSSTRRARPCAGSSARGPLSYARPSAGRQLSRARALPGSRPQSSAGSLAARP